MFGSSRSQEETFDFLPKKEEKKPKEIPTEQPQMEELVEKINTITSQINLISKYLSYLSQKFDKTIDDAMTYDKTLDDIEGRINSLKKKIDHLEIVSPDVDLADDRTQAI